MNTFGIVGKNISYSFSQPYFTQKFKDLNLINHQYKVFDIQDIADIKKILSEKDLIGFNVTIPYKEQIIPYLDNLSDAAKKIGAVNTVKVENGKAIGYNTDVVGFKDSLLPLLKPYHQKALILGTGGASKAVEHVLNELGIEYQKISRSQAPIYEDISKDIMDSHTIIINCTPLGTFPHIENCPDIPYDYMTPRHLVYDLIYNPEKTKFLQLAKNKGATIKNGYDMLIGQAEESWSIWNK